MKKIAFWNGSVFTLVLAAALLAAPDISAQGTGAAAPRREISRDLWNLWRKGFELFEKGEMKMISGKYEESIPFYQQSLDAFNQVKKQNPDWNKSVIDYRISLSTRRIASAKRKAKEAAESAKRVAERKKYEAEARAVREKDEKYKAVSNENEKLKKQLEALQGELKNVRYNAERGNAAIKQIRELLAERDVLEKKLAVLNLQYTELLEKHKKASISPETEKLLTTEQAKNAAFMKLIKEQNDELANIKKQYNELTAEKEKRDKMLEDVSKTLSNEKTFAEVERKKLQDDLAEAKKKLEETGNKLKASSIALAEKTRAAEEAAELISKLKAGQTLAASARRIETEAAAVKKDNETLRKAVASAVAEKAELTGKLAKEMEASAKLKKDLVLNIEQRNSFAKANDSMSKQLAELEKNFRKMAEDNTAMKKELAKATADRDLFAKKVNEKFNDMADKRIAELKTQIASLNTALAAQKKTNESLAAASRKQVEESAKLAAAKAELEAQLKKQDAALAGQSDAAGQMARKNAEVKVLREKLAANEAAAKKLAGEMETLKRSLAASKKVATDSKEVDTARLESAIAALTAKLTATEKTLKEVSASRDGFETQVKTMKAQIAKADDSIKENAALKHKVTELSGKLASQEQARTALEAVKKSLETEVANLKSKSVKQAAELPAGSDAAKAELTRLTASLIELREANAQYENAVRNLTSARKKLEAEKGELAQKLAEAEKQLEARDVAPNNSVVAKENLELKEKVVRSEKLYAELKAERNELASRRVTLDKEVVKLRQENENLKKSETLLKADLKRWSEGAGGVAGDTIAKKNQAIDELIRELESGKADRKKMELEITDLRNEASRQKIRADKAVETAKKAVSDSRRFRRELANLRADIEDGMIPSKSSGKPGTSVTVTSPEKGKDTKEYVSITEEKPTYNVREYQQAMDQARAAEAKKDWGTALWQYWRAADIAGKRPEPYLALVRIHLQRNEKESAEKAYRKALQYGAERDASLEEQFK